MAISWIETRNSLEHTIDNRGRWSGVRRFHSSEADLVDNRTDLRTETWTVNSITMNPKKVRVVSRDPEQPGAAIIECHYRFSDNPYDFTDTKARMAILSWGKEELMTYDNSDTPLAVNTEPDTDNEFFRPTEGSPTQTVTRSKVILKTAYPVASIDWSTITSGFGKTNSAQLAKAGFLTVEIGEMMLLTAGVPDMYVFNDDDAIVPIRYEFEYRKGGWPDLKAQKYWRGPRKALIMHSTDNPDGARVYMKEDGGVAANDTEAAYRIITKDWAIDAPSDRVRHKTHDFSTIYAMLSWS